MKSLIRGEKVKLSDYTSCKELQVEISIQSSLEIDITCFGLNADKKIVDDRFVVFYNQLQSPNREMCLTSHGNGYSNFLIDLSHVPLSTVQNLVLTATIDNNGTMSMISSGYMLVKANGQPILKYEFTGNQFENEKAIIISEIYYKSMWRLSAVGQGFNGGLATLLEHFGGEVADKQEAQNTVNQQMPIPIVNSKKILLEKKMAKQAPKLLDLSKKAKISLEKVGLQNHEAKVALCLDISGSMYELYRSGKIQEFAERILALGTRFDDDGSIDIFLFGQYAHDAGELTIDNFDGFVNRMIRRYPLEGATYYSDVMKMVREHYFGFAQRRREPLSKETPVYVMFLTDGAAFDETRTIGEIESSSYEPIFWQFMAIGESNYDAYGNYQNVGNFGFLEELDNLTGRFIDNANFFHVADPAGIPDNQLYDLLMTEYPGWVKLARSKGLILQKVGSRM
ncbi:tellurium resistance protein [Bacillus pseudomycoides]|uniref:Tellurium resistance protein n=2 Tax=Bacillus TaxID=1386 RepID=A0AA91VC64_9BACI|nr:MULTISPECIES: VWA domain-containing protein [Bacillus]PEB47841.1 tellurium resistance protein [Bacillus sp. AFS098217]PED81963.1 tellurium resistance protein [Bacillus pseudomycoides]PEU09147.1 tellurium resistance protein [Bacillus sp. AFS014408]PFW60084.1 tellurium resistance protein [Bacillus sp. AFS075034]